MYSIVSLSICLQMSFYPSYLIGANFSEASWESCLWYILFLISAFKSKAPVSQLVNADDTSVIEIKTQHYLES